MHWGKHPPYVADGFCGDAVGDGDLGAAGLWAALLLVAGLGTELVDGLGSLGRSSKFQAQSKRAAKRHCVLFN